MESIEAHPNTGQPFNFHRRWTAGLVGDCPPKAKVTRSNRVGAPASSITGADRQERAKIETHHRLTNGIDAHQTLLTARCVIYAITKRASECADTATHR